MSEKSSPQPREIAEQRGDFMLLPPLTPTFGRPARLQQTPADFLVTRRPTAVTTAGLAHAVDHELLGRVKGRARRARGRRRGAPVDLDHLITPGETDDLDETLEDSLPPPAPPAPRILRSVPTTGQPQRRVPASMPSRVDVRRAVSAPAPSNSDSPLSTTEPTVDFDSALAELPPSTFPSVGQSSPVVRRRRGSDPVPQPVAETPAEVSEQLTETSQADVVVPRDGNEPPAIRRRQPRGRVHQPPEDLLSSVPIEQPSLSSASRTQDLRSSAGVVGSSSETPGEQSAIRDLAHRTQDEEPTATLASTPPASTAPPASSTPPSASPVSNADVPMTTGSEPAMPPAPSSAPLAPGSTGIQRRARGEANLSAPPSGETSQETSMEMSGGAVLGESRPLVGDGSSVSRLATGSSVPSAALTSPTALTSPVPGVAPKSGEASGGEGAASGDSRPLLGESPSSSRVSPGSTGIQGRARDDAGSSAPSMPSPPAMSSTSSEVSTRPVSDAPPLAGEMSAITSGSAVSGEARPLLGDGPSPTSSVAPGSSGIQRRSRDRSEPSVSSTSATAPSATPAPDTSTALSASAGVPVDSAVPAGPASRPLVADVPPIGSPERSANQRRSRDEADDHGSAAAAGLDIAVQGSPSSTPFVGRDTRPGILGPSDSEPNPSEPMVGVDSTDSQPPTTPEPRAGGRTSSSTTSGVPASDSSLTPRSSRGSSPASNVAASVSRPTLASSGRTGIQRRERSRAAGGDASQSGGLAALGSMPEPRVQGPRRIAVPEPVRQILRETVGEPPAHVTVHEGGAAGQMTDSVNAEAFTRDGQIYFANDAPVDSARGQQLLAHELTHVIQQQGRSGSMPGEHTDEGQDLERAARQVEDHMVHGRGRSARVVVRAPKAEGEEPTPLHHRTGSMDAPSMRTGGAGAVTSSGSQAITQSSGNTISSSSTHGVDAGVQRKAREPSRGILDGIGDTASKAWSKSRESLLGQLEQEFSGPPKSNKEPDSRAKQLERQAADLYPYLRRRLRAELVRDLERRGRL